MNIFASFVLLVAFLSLIVVSLFRSRRSPLDVLVDLEPDEVRQEAPAGVEASSTVAARRRREQEFREAGIFTPEERSQLLLREKLFPTIGALLAVLGVFAAGKGTAMNGVLALMFGVSLGYLFFRRSLAKRKFLYHRRIDFFLPLVMERLVMGVQAGLDVFATLKALLELESHAEQKQEGVTKRDPVTELLQEVVQLTEKGLGFEDALHEVASRIPSPALRHAFLHLGMAHREGGELIYPLRELSDATQLYFQETVEEEIAKLPVKATLPLLVTFVGLLILFVTAPMLQVLDFLAQAGPK